MRSGILRFIVFYFLGILLLYISLFLSNHVSYNSYFISDLPIIMPMVFSLVALGISVLFILDKSYPWFFRTGVISLADGVTFFVFGIVSYSLSAKPIIWASTLGIGILFIIGAVVRLLIQGGLSAYRKIRA